MTLGEYINNYINEHDMSIRKFASLAGVSHSYISNIINGKTARGNNPAPTIQIYRGLAKAMGISVEELIYRVESGEIAWGEQKVPTTPKGSEREEEYEEFYKNIFSKLSQENVDFLIAQGQFLLNHQKSQDGQE
jgi:transcriptional regulator with XRE-family HTH domain